MADYMVAHFDELDVVQCPCGYAQRAFKVPDNTAATLHVVEVTENSTPHYHKEHTEIYFILSGEGHVEIDGQVVPVKPETAVLIKPGCRHRPVGRMRMINVSIPPFDPADEYVD